MLSAVEGVMPRQCDTYEESMGGFNYQFSGGGGTGSKEVEHCGYSVSDEVFGVS